jgi:hypothetical protein
MHPSLFAAPVIALAACLPLAAADLGFTDLRLGAGLLSDHFSGSNQSTVSSGGTVISSSSSSDDGRDAEHNYRGQLQVVGGNLGPGGGLVLGVGIAVNHASWDNGSQDATVTTPCVDLLIGYGFAFNRAWHVELTPFAGIGRAYYSVTDNGQTETAREWDKYVEFGARLGTYFTINEGFQIGLEIPYLVGSFEPHYEYTDASNNTRTVADKRENRGFGLLVTIGGRF